MYEYDFVRIKTGGFLRLEPVEDYHELVHRRAREGWRLVQVLAPPIAGHGLAPWFELIFEREAPGLPAP